MLTRLIIGYTSLINFLKLIGKHWTGLCIHCGEVGNVKHTLDE